MREPAYTSTVVVVEIDLPDLRLNQFDQQGRLLASSSRSIEVIRDSPGSSVVDPDTLRLALYERLAECVTQSGSTPDVISLTGNNDGLALLDDQGRFARQVVMPNDLRAAPVIEHLIDTGIAAAGYRATGSTVWSGSTVALLRHLCETEPDLGDQTLVAAGQLGGLAISFSGQAILPVALAPLPIVDPHHGAYDEGVIDLLKLRPLRHQLPIIAPGSASLEPPGDWGHLRELAAPDCAVHAGTLDITAAMTASGAIADDLGHVHLGSSLLCAATNHRADSGSEPGGSLLPTDSRQRWIRCVPSSAGLSALDWLLSTIGANYKDLNALVAGSAPGAGGVLIVPVMSEAGEHGAFLDPLARSQMDGYHRGTTRADLARAMCEGIALTARAALDVAGAQPAELVHFTGAGVRAPEFRQLLADVLGRRVLVWALGEPVARGAAMTALEAVGVPIDRTEWMGSGELIEPDAALRDLYDEQFGRFQAAVNARRNAGPR